MLMWMVQGTATALTTMCMHSFNSNMAVHICPDACYLTYNNPRHKHRHCAENKSSANLPSWWKNQHIYVCTPWFICIFITLGVGDTYGWCVSVNCGRLSSYMCVSMNTFIRASCNLFDWRKPATSPTVRDGRIYHPYLGWGWYLLVPLRAQNFSKSQMAPKWHQKQILKKSLEQTTFIFDI